MTTPFRRGIFSPVGLRVGGAIAPALATPAYLHDTVLALRGSEK
jgi:hypothetical protein